MSSDDVVLNVNNISKRYEIYEKPQHRFFQTLFQGHKQFYKEFWALRDVSFDVKKGECVGIVGRNGSGKSTLLQIIAGTLGATAGTISGHGRVAALLELGSGFNPEFTGRENVYMNGMILGLTRSEVNAKYDDIIEFADIGDFIDQPVKTYSSGMMVRLAFATATAVDPDILIVDEALAVGDVRFQLKCYRRIDLLKESGKTILFVSHSGGDVTRLCSRAMWLEQGEVRCIGPSKNVVEEYMAWMVHGTGTLQVTQDTEPAPVAPDQPSYELVPIPPNSCITGEGGAMVEAIGIFSEDNKRISLLDGSKPVKIVYRVMAKERIDFPFFAFQIVNNKGLRLFGSNTYVQGAKIDKY